MSSRTTCLLPFGRGLHSVPGPSSAVPSPERASHRLLSPSQPQQHLPQEAYPACANSLGATTLGFQASPTCISQVSLALPFTFSCALKPNLIGFSQSPFTAKMKCDLCSAKRQLVERTPSLLANPLAALVEAEALRRTGRPLCQMVAEASQSPGLPAARSLPSQL